MDDWLKPTWEPLWLSCGPCGHWWDDWQPCHVPVETWTAHIRSLRCPACGSKRRLFIRMKPLSERPEHEAARLPPETIANEAKLDRIMDRARRKSLRIIP